MIDTDLGLIFALILIVVLIVFDLAFHRFRHAQFDQDEPEFSLWQDALRRVREWIASRRTPSATLPPSDANEPAQPAQPAPEPRSTPAAASSESAVVVQSAPPAAADKPIPPVDRPMVHVEISADFPEGTIVQITLDARDGQGKGVVQRSAILSHPAREFGAIREKVSSSTLPGLQPSNDGQFNLGAILLALPLAVSRMFRDETGRWRFKFETILFALALIVYLSTRLVGLTQFPIYFFGDEAVQTVQALNLVNNNFKGPDGVFLPTYFQNGPYYNLSVSVYAQVIPYMLFGASVFVTRATSVLITLLAAICIGLILRDFLKAKYWWLGTLLLSIAPAWFLHSRTAFETAIFTSLFAASLYFYLLYRFRSPNYLYVTLVLAALAFYSYSAGQLTIGVTMLVLFILDWRYHWQNRRMILYILVVVAIVAAPYIRFRMQNSFSPEDHLKELGSYWINDIPLGDKISRFVSLYIYGLSPAYWFIPNTQDLARHVMLNYGHLMLWTLPLYLLGVVIAILNLRSPAHRAVLVALLATPIGTALVDVGITRILAFIVPATILTALGLSQLLSWLENPAEIPWVAAMIQKGREIKLWHIPDTLLAVVVFCLLAVSSFMMTRDALQNGPTWFQDYSLYGMQYGAQQVFGDTVRPALAQDPNLTFVVSPSWANGAEQFTSFFIPPALQAHVMLGQPGDLINNLSRFTPQTVFISTPDEYTKLQQDPAYKTIKVLKTIPYPNGDPGFYELAIAPADNIQQIVAAQDALNRKPVEDSMPWNGQTVRVIHSPLGSGQVTDMFDNDPDTLARVLEANPFVVDIYLQKPINIKSLFLKTGSMHNYTVTVRLYAADGTVLPPYSQTFQDLPNKDLPPDPEITMQFDNAPALTSRIDLEVLDNTSGDTSQIHIRTIQFK